MVSAESWTRCWLAETVTTEPLQGDLSASGTEFAHCTSDPGHHVNRFSWVLSQALTISAPVSPPPQPFPSTRCRCSLLSLSSPINYTWRAICRCPVVADNSTLWNRVARMSNASTTFPSRRRSIAAARLLNSVALRWLSRSPKLGFSTEVR